MVDKPATGSVAAYGRSVISSCIITKSNYNLMALCYYFQQAQYTNKS